MRRKWKKICEICSKEFEVETKYKANRTCSKKCHKKLVSISIKNSPKFIKNRYSSSWVEKQRENRLGKKFNKKNPISEQSREKHKRYMIEFYEKYPEEKSKRTKKANEKKRESFGLERHDKAIEEEITKFEKEGYKCFCADRERPDFIAKKDGKIYVVEVEFGDKKLYKYKNNTFFDDIIWIKKEVDKN